ncbi:MAG: ABC transporter ATP-binding protein [Deltaproteobacteria bacterium]
MVAIDHLKKEFVSGRGRVSALVDVSFSADKGASVVVLGKSGSGKSTLLNCIGGFERPDKGRVVCMGRDIHSLSSGALSLFQRREMGFVFQGGNLLSYLTVEQNIYFPLTLNGITGSASISRVEELLDKVGLKGIEKAMPQELSGGEYQRVAVARALAHKPALVVADEPTASLDSATGRALTSLIFGLCRDEGTTVVMATHDADIIALADLTVHLLDGRVVK